MKSTLAWASSLLWLSGCATPGAPASPSAAAAAMDSPPTASSASPGQQPADQVLSERVPGAPALPWQDTPADAQAVLPEGPLSQDQAVALSLQRSPALRTLLAQNQAQIARARVAARPGLLGFSIERMRQGDDLSWTRTLSLGLMDLLSWPWRQAAADRRIDLAQQQAARQVLAHVQTVRVQWVKAVAAQQRSQYQQDVLQAARTAGELARRMQAAGHFSAAQAAQHAAAAVEAQLAVTQTRRLAVAEREALVRLVGLSPQEASQLALPERLPELPAQAAWTEARLQDAARTRALDLQLAERQWQAARGQGRDENLRGVIDLEAAYSRETGHNEATKQGPELSLRLVNIDFGAARRDAVRQEERVALAQWQQAVLNAESRLRERWQDYEATLDTAQQAARTLAPVRQQLLNERLKQYNGMLIGPFELLAEARQHIGGVLTAFDAQRDFWLADAALTAAVDGVDLDTPRATPNTAASAASADAAH